MQTGEKMENSRHEHKIEVTLIEVIIHKVLGPNRSNNYVGES
jgi:hypothetical protein